MHVRGEDLSLRSMGIDVHEYLLWPRLLAFVLSGSILSFCFAFCAIWLGGLLVSFSDKIAFVDFLSIVRAHVGVHEFVVFLLKSALYPFLCALMLLSQACCVGREANRIPLHATRGVFGSLVLIFFTDAIIVVIMQL